MIPQIITVFDTETTGVNPSEARIVQYAHARVALPDFRTIQVFSAVVKPDGFDVPVESTAIHGYNHDFCVVHGVGLQFVLERHLAALRASNEAWAYNCQYDKGVITAECARVGKVYEGIEKVRCAMLPLVNVCKIPFPSKRAGFKWPKLAEAYNHFFQKPFAGMHNALGDVFATIDILRAFDPWGQAERVVGDKL